MTFTNKRHAPFTLPHGMLQDNSGIENTGGKLPGFLRLYVSFIAGVVEGRAKAKIGRYQGIVVIEIDLPHSLHILLQERAVSHLNTI